MAARRMRPTRTPWYALALQPQQCELFRQQSQGAGMFWTS